MAVAVEMHNTGDPELQRDVVVIVEHVLSDRPGEWRVSIVGSQGSDRWEMRITGPNAFERSYTLEGTAGEHEPHAIAALVARDGAGKVLISTAHLDLRKQQKVYNPRLFTGRMRALRRCRLAR